MSWPPIDNLNEEVREILGQYSEYMRREGACLVPGNVPKDQEYLDLATQGGEGLGRDTGDGDEAARATRSPIFRTS
jgi:hypothetical protein